MTRRGRAAAARPGQMVALLCALALALIPGALLGAQRAQAAAQRPQTHFYGVRDSAMLTGTATPTDTATATATTAATATATATATTTATATATSTATVTATATSTSTATPAPTATPSGPPPNSLDVTSAATAAGWPQQNGNWCGIATVALIADYLNPGSPVSQSWVYGALNNPANISMWGTPPPPTGATWGVTTWGPYLNADIAQDFGTDPRSIAEGLTVATGQNYHVVVDTSGAYDATIHIVDDLMLTRQPISVFVDHGEHSVIVSGVDATGNPLTNPGSITAIHVWDPGGGVNYVGIQPSLEQTVSMSTWLNGIIPWSGGDYFKYPYAANLYSGLPLDPDPSVGPYAYVPSKYNHLWIGHYVYVSPRASGAAAGLSADWELNQNGAVLAGFASAQWAALPAGYSGPSVLMPTNPPPPPPPVQVITFVPPAPRPPQPTPTPRPIPTATPKLKLRPSPTPIPAVDTPAPSATAASDSATCAALACALAAGPPMWALAALALALLLGLALSVWGLTPSRSAQIAAVVANDAPLLPTLPDAAEETTGDAALSAATLGEVRLGPVIAAEPKIVPVLDADAPHAEPAHGDASD